MRNHQQSILSRRIQETISPLAQDSVAEWIKSYPNQEPRNEYLFCGRKRRAKLLSNLRNTQQLYSLPQLNGHYCIIVKLLQQLTMGITDVLLGLSLDGRVTKRSPKILFHWKSHQGNNNAFLFLDFLQQFCWFNFLFSFSEIYLRFPETVKCTIFCRGRNF